MTRERGQEFGFAPAHDAPIPYMQRIRDYYVTLGYGAPYEWAHYAEVPFQPLKKPLAQSRITIVTTAAPYQPDKGDQGPGRAVQLGGEVLSRSTPATRRRITICASVTWGSTASTRRPRTPAPGSRCRSCARAAARGRIGAVAPRFHGLPTNRSHRMTLDVDCPELVARCKADGVDAALLLANCPVCHQSISLAARALEAAGIPTVVMGCAKDIVEHVGVPRLAVLGLPARQCRRAAEGPEVAGLHAGACPEGAGDRARPRAPPCSRRLPGAAVPTGSSTSRTSRACRPRRSRAAAPSSTSRSRSQRSCARTWGCSATRRRRAA